MKILATCLPDLERIMVQRPHHLLYHLSKNNEIVAICTKAWNLEKNSDLYLNKILGNIKMIYLTDARLSSVRQEFLPILSTHPTMNPEFLHQFDVHINFNSLISGYFRTRKMSGMGIPSVFDICDDLVDWVGLSPQVPPVLKPLGKATAKLLLSKTVDISTIVTYTTRSLLKITSSRARPVCVPNGVDTDLFVPKYQGTLRSKIGFSQDDTVLGFVGALGEWVNLEPLIAALDREKNTLSSYKLLIVGSGPKRAEIQYMAKQYSCENAIVFSGTVPYEQVPDYINCMDVCILPFTEDDVSQKAVPLKLFEYMSCEKPVIASPLAGIKDAVNSHVLYASNADEYTLALLEYKRKPELACKMGKEGREFVKTHYGWNNICVKFEETIIEQVKSAGKDRDGIIEQ